MIDLAHNDRRWLLSVLVRTFNRRTSAEGLLTAIGYPPDLVPEWVDDRVQTWWILVFRQLDNGVTGDPFRRLIAAGHRRHRRDRALRELFDRYVAAQPAPRATTRSGPADAGLPRAEEVDDQVPWQADSPTTMDMLNREVLAKEIAGVLRRRLVEEPNTFLALLDGRWGTGKSSILHMVTRQEAVAGWTVARYDAWRLARIGRPWWTLLTTVRQAVFGRMPWWRRPLAGLAEVWHMRVARTPVALAAVLVVLLATGLFLLLRPAHLTVSTMQAGLQTVVAVAAALGTLWAGAVVSARTLLWGSARAARFFEQTVENPMPQVAEHLGWLCQRAGRPLLLVVDDLDRCRPAEVVEILESIQTLLRDPPSGRSGRPAPVAVVVAADAVWLHAAFESEYSVGSAIVDPGQSIGHLFCDKIFQLVVPVPNLGMREQSGYLAALLGLPADPADQVNSTLMRDGRDRLDASKSEAELLATMEDMPEPAREQLGPKAVEVLTKLQSNPHHNEALAMFAPLLPANPRSMKRFLNDYNMARVVRSLLGDPVPVAALAQWNAIRIHWPVLAYHLRDQPDDVEDILASAVDAPTPELLPLWTNPAVHQALNFANGIQLTPELIRRCCGEHPQG